MKSLARILALTASEFRVALRNRWVLLATVTLALFALALAFVGSAPGGEVKVDALTLTAASLATLTVYLVPLMALLISYDAFAGEVERGTLALVLATPVRRGEILLAKILGALGVIAIAILVGYGIAGGMVVWLNGWTEAGLMAWARLIGSALPLGAVFLALGVTLSACVRQTGTAAALAVCC
jgi:Cu-processing system permease protein